MFKKNQNIIFLWNGYYGDEEESEMDGTIVHIGKDTVAVCCLSGTKSHNEDVPFDKIVAIVDNNERCTNLKNYRGHFLLTKFGETYLKTLNKEN